MQTNVQIPEQYQPAFIKLRIIPIARSFLGQVYCIVCAIDTGQLAPDSDADMSGLLHHLKDQAADAVIKLRCRIFVAVVEHVRTV